VSQSGPQMRVVRARRRWRAGLLQLLFMGIGIALGVLLPRIHAGATVATSRTVEVLGAVGFGILGLVTLIYSLLFLVVQSSNTTFTPRLNLFQDDPWIWRTYAVAVGLFAFSMSAFLEIGNAEKVTVAVPIFAFVVALGVIVLIRNIQAKAFSSLQVNAIVDLLQRRGRQVIDDVYPPKGGPARKTVPSTGGHPVRWLRPQTTLQQLDLRRLLNEAENGDAAIVFRTKVGQTLWAGATVAEVYGHLDDDAVLSACVTGANRTVDQDPLLAFRLLSDIGLRALSPAVNDPATAVQAWDAIVGLLVQLTSRDLDAGTVESPDGTTRIWLDLPGWGDFMREGCDELLSNARNSPMMLARATETLTLLEEAAPPGLRPGVEARRREVESDLAAGHAAR